MILEWLANGKTGASSKSLAFATLGIDQSYISYPYDPADLNRCFVLYDLDPLLVEDGLKSLSKIHRVWKELHSQWSSLRAIFEEEVGLNWSKGNAATKTYAVMKEIRDL